jgi:hypothetical protein
MKLALRKIADVVLSTTTVVLLAALVVYVAGHMGTIGY